MGRTAAHHPGLNRRINYGFSTSPDVIAYHQKQGTIAIIPAEIVDARGDADPYMARYSKVQLTYATNAPAVARKLLNASQIEEALAVRERARRPKLRRHSGCP
ncbi:DUF6880 family protein [Paracoccus liaowanqingii]|uniref:DUF6880 family protein n=1 Tax=Paracoccus liaowanqingii TaxID=2560053 RepID=UPI0034E0120C